MIEEFAGESDHPSDLRRLQQLEMALSTRSVPVRYFSYKECEAAAEKLASQILEVTPRRHLGQWAFIPNPRGGLIVLGMLAYLLQLEPHQLPPTHAGDRPLVLVDDVALTGARLRRLVDMYRNKRLIIALLASHPELRRAVESESNVDACISGVDLEGADDESAPARREEEEAMWAERLPGNRYWHGRPEMIALPWSEPDQLLWDPENSTVESGWRLVSPELVLKSRADLGPPSADPASRELGFPNEIAHGAFDDGFLVCLLDTEEVFRLDSQGAAIWGTIGTLGDVESARRHLIRGDAADMDIDGFAKELLDAGLLVRLTQPG